MNSEEIADLVSYNLSFGISILETLNMFDLLEYKEYFEEYYEEYFEDAQSSSASDSSSESK